jgi:uncharacterized protein (DUF488 family)
MMVLAALAAWRGSKQGDAAKTQAVKAAPFVSIAGSIVEANKFGDYIKTLDKLAIAITGHPATLNKQHDVKVTNALEAMAERVDEALEAARHKRR